MHSKLVESSSQYTPPEVLQSSMPSTAMLGISRLHSVAASLSSGVVKVWQTISINSSNTKVRSNFALACPSARLWKSSRWIERKIKAATADTAALIGRPRAEITKITAVTDSLTKTNAVLEALDANCVTKYVASSRVRSEPRIKRPVIKSLTT